MALMPNNLFLKILSKKIPAKIAIEEGATFIRLGTLLFQGLEAE